MYAKRWDAALQAFAEAINAKNSVGNPLLHLRIGQCAYYLKLKDIYEDNLARALITGGLEVFNNENDELKEVPLKILQPPVDGGKEYGWEEYPGIDYGDTK